MAMAVGGGSGAQANINVTPMIDILLVLLIIFMAISPVAPHGLDALAPQPPPPNQQQNPADDRTVVIVIGKNKDDLKINQEDTTWAKLEDRLVDIFKTRAEKVVFVKGDPDLEFQTVATAIDIAHSAGIDKVGLMTPKVEEGK